MSRPRKITMVVILVAAVTAVAAMQVPINSAWMFGFTRWRINRGRVRILYGIGHEALLKACRELSQQAGVGRHESRV